VRTEHFRRGLGSILLAFAIVLFMTFSMTFTAPPVLARGGVIYTPGGTTIEVGPSQEFTLRFKLYWDEPEWLGYFWFEFYWESPRKDNLNQGTENENFTFVSASAYFEDNLDPISIGLTFAEGVSPENSAMWRHAIVVSNPVGNGGDDNFYVDVVMRAAGAGGVPHVLTNNHPIVIWGSIDVAEPTTVSYTPPNPYITIKVTSYTGTAVFSLVDLYTVNVEKILDLYAGSKLVVKFYTYGDTFENENVIENFSPPWHVEENEKVSHPYPTLSVYKTVKRARLDLTYDNTENVILTIASWTTRRSDLISRISDIRAYWPFVVWPVTSLLITEISHIKSLWPYAPP